YVEADLCRQFLQLVAAELRAVLEDQVVHLPELPLFTGRYRGLGRRHGVGVHGGREGEVLVGEVDVLRVLLEDFVDQTGRPSAERSLEVGELDDRDLGVLRAPHLTRGDGNGVDLVR